MKQRHALCAAAMLFAVAAPVLACLWDNDTLAMERQRFPDALELITGKFLRHSQAYYEWRVEDRLKRIEAKPEDLALYDDLAVAYDKLGQHDKAIETVLKKDQLKPGLYETAANLGTFHIHAGRLEEGLKHIYEAIKINPDAHFGREIYQARLVEYVLKQQVDGKTPLPMSERSAAYGDAGFWAFIRLPPDKQNGDHYEHRKKAIKGVLGMMRFGQHDSPILLEALGDLLHANDDKRLATRAYLKASYAVSGDAAREAYRKHAEMAIAMQTDINSNQEGLGLPALEKTFKAELDEAEKWYAKIDADEKKWIASDGDVDEAFKAKYYNNPVANVTDAAASRFGNKRWIILVTFIASGLAMLAIVWRRKNARQV